jgi:hypothetical protein
MVDELRGDPMRRLSPALLLAMIVVICGAAGALAAEMTGRFQTNTQPVTYFEFRQQGTALAGTLSGGDTGTLTGTITGDQFTGKLALTGGLEVDFRGTFAPAGFTFTIFGPGGTQDFALTPVAAENPTPTAAAQYFWLSGPDRKGPISLDELKSLIVTHAVTADTLVWTAGMPDWTKAGEVADLNPAFLPAADYYVLDGGNRTGPLKLDTLLARLRAGESKSDSLVWKAGMADWARADTLPELNAALQQAPAPPQPPTHMTADTITLNGLPGTTATDLHKSSIVLGAVLGVMFHEVGHMLIGELDLPSTGPEEDAADEFSAILLGVALNPKNNTDVTPEGLQWITDIARYSTLLWRYTEQSKRVSSDWFDEHSNTARRFRNTLCRIYGSSPDTYQKLADSVDLPPDQRRLCQFEFPKHFLAWKRIAATVSRDPGDEDSMPGNLPANTPGKAVLLQFEPSKIGTGEALAPLFQQVMFSDLAQALGDGFVFTKRDVRIVFKDCGVINAWYDPARGTITMCWEAVEFFAGVILDAEHVARH